MKSKQQKSIIIIILLVSLCIFTDTQKAHALFGYDKIKVEIDDYRNLKIARLKVSCSSEEKAAIMPYKIIMYFKNEMKAGRIVKSQLFFNIQEAPSNLRILEDEAVLKLNDKVFTLKIDNRDFEPVREGRNIIGSVILDKNIMENLKKVDVVILRLFPGRMLTFKLQEKSIVKVRELFNKK